MLSIQHSTTLDLIYTSYGRLWIIDRLGVTKFSIEKLYWPSSWTSKRVKTISIRRKKRKEKVNKLDTTHLIITLF